MKCLHCNAELNLRAEYCPKCGNKVNLDFAAMAQSVHEDADVRRGRSIQTFLGWLVLVLIVVATVVYGINELYDRPLTYDGSGLPAFQTEGAMPLNFGSATVSYREPRPAPPLPQALRTSFGARYEPLRTQLREANAGAVKTGKTLQAAVNDGLKFLSKNQAKDGGWMVQAPRNWPKDETPQYEWGRVGVTGLALLAFLGEGESWRPDDLGRQSLYADTVKKGVRFLLDQQDAATGRFGPGVGEAVHFMYNHGLATWAMVEAAGLTGDEHLRASAQKGLDLIVKTQASKGGWNYWGRTVGDSDTFVTAWQVQAMLAAREAGFTVPEEVLQKAHEMYRAATHADGYVSYNLEEKTNDKDERGSRTAVALTLRQMLGEEAGGLRVLESKLLGVPAQVGAPLAALREVRKEWGVGWAPNSQNTDDYKRAGYDPHVIYYVTYGLFMAGGPGWETWNEAMKAAVPLMQDNDGSWRTNDPYSMQGGLVYSTALSIMTLQVYYRVQ